VLLTQGRETASTAVLGEQVFISLLFCRLSTAAAWAMVAVGIYLSAAGRNYLPKKSLRPLRSVTSLIYLCR